MDMTIEEFKSAVAEEFDLNLGQGAIQFIECADQVDRPDSQKIRAGDAGSQPIHTAIGADNGDVFVVYSDSLIFGSTVKYAPASYYLSPHEAIEFAEALRTAADRAIEQRRREDESE